MRNLIKLGILYLFIALVLSMGVAFADKETTAKPKNTTNTNMVDIQSIVKELQSVEVQLQNATKQRQNAGVLQNATKQLQNVTEQLQTATKLQNIAILQNATKQLQNVTEQLQKVANPFAKAKGSLPIALVLEHMGEQQHNAGMLNNATNPQNITKLQNATKQLQNSTNPLAGGPLLIEPAMVAGF